MMANAIPIATHTGFAEDVLTGELSKNILAIDGDINEVISTIRRAFLDHTSDFRPRARAISWQAKAEQILGLMRPKMGFDRVAGLLPAYGVQSFDLRSNGRKLLGSGWRYVGENPVMTKAGSTIVFQVTDKAPGMYRLGVTLIHPGETQATNAAILMRVNGQIVGSAEFAFGSPILIEGWLYLNEDHAFAPVEVAFELVGEAASLDDLSGTQAVSIQLKLVEFESSGNDYVFALTSGDVNLLGVGWHKAESAGVWTNSQVASLALFPDVKDQDREVRLILTGAGFGTSLQDGNTIHARAMVDGKFFDYRSELSDDAVVEMHIESINIPAFHSGPVVLTITKNLFQPSEVFEGNVDSRLLGYRIEKASVVNI
jgi:hypothetical protein